MLTRPRLHPIVAMASLAGGVLPALAQTMNPPTFYMWGSYPTEIGVPYTPTTGKVRRIVQQNLNNGFYDNGNFVRYYLNPERLASDIATEIHDEIVSQRLSESTVTILLQNFGFDSVVCDAAQGEQESDLGGARFFQANGVDRLPGIGEWTNSPTPRFPSPRSPATPVSNGREKDDYGYARAYRHPFLRNGKPNPPLRAWFQRFVDRLDQEYQARYNTPNAIPHPQTYRYYFDVEPLFVAEAGENGVWFLDYLADPSQYNAQLDPNTYWDNSAFLVPGTGGKTLRQCYNDYRIANNCTDWPVDNPKSSLGLGGDYRFYVSANAPFMTWYGELCTKVRDVVLDNCFHSVLRDKWPGHTVRSGNYYDCTTDGASDVFGWASDRQWLGDVAQSNIDPTTWFPSETFARFSQHKARGGRRNYLAQTGGGGDPRRLLDFKTHASGTTDTPVMYPIRNTELYGVDTGCARTVIDYSCDPDGVERCVESDEGGTEPGHNTSRTMWYDSSHPNESPFQTTLRFHRDTAEAILNSAGSGTNNPARDMSPWMIMPLANENDQVSSEDFVSRATARNLLAMLRGKNIKEGMFWTRWYIRNAGTPPCGEPTRQESIERLFDAWDQTQRSVMEVYSTQVKKYTRTWALADTYEDANESAAAKASRLEFTLRQFPQIPRTEREVRLKSKLAPVICCDSPAVYQTVLTIDFDWIDLAYAGTPELGYADSRRKAEINIECSIEFTGANSGHTPSAQDTGRVQVWSAASGAYIEVGTYTFNAPVSNEPGTGDNRWRMRLQTVVDPGWNAQYVFPDTAASNAPRTRLRLIHQSPVSFQSRYDLVQFVPTDENYMIGIQQMRMANSDMNHDGVTDDLDLNIFLEEWMDDSPAADVDADGAVTGVDAEAFVDAYVQGT